MSATEQKFPSCARWICRIAGISGVAIGWGAMYLFDNLGGPIFWILICLAVALGYGGAWGGLSNRWGAPPFTTDPLGWRKAKQTYAQDQEQQSGSNDADLK